MRKVLIAGASSSLGSALIDCLLTDSDIEIVALSRKERNSLNSRVKWKKCDLFSLKDISLAMEEVSEGYYLVHSSPSSATLMQGKEEDYEVLMADNFIRAALHFKLKQIHLSDLVNDEIKGLFKASSIPLVPVLSEKLKIENKKPEPFTPEEKTVRSIQRLVLPPGRSAEWVALEYFKWLPFFFSSLVSVLIEGNRCTFYLFHPSVKILILQKSIERSSPDRQLLYVVGGLLAGRMERGRLEFREVLNHRYVMAALHEFRPALPWYIYRWTQALVHIVVMKAFGEHMKWHVLSQKKAL